MKELNIDPNLHRFCIQQARALAKLARSVTTKPESSISPEDKLAYLVTSSLSIELYLKSLMIGMRKGRFPKTHSLRELYNEFPPIPYL